MQKGTIKPTNITISFSTIVKILVVVIGVTFMWFIRDVVAVFFVALLLAALIEPFASWLESKKIPRGIGVLIVYVVLLSLVALALVVILPPLIKQVKDLGRDLPTTFVDARLFFDKVVSVSEEYGLAENLTSSIASLQNGLASSIGGLFVTVKGIMGGIGTLFLVFVVAFYMIAEEGMAKRAVKHFAPAKYQPYIAGLTVRIQTKLGAWLRGQIFLMLVIGSLTYVGLLILGVDYALALGIFAGIAEIVPYAGPVIAMIPAVVIAFSVSPFKALLVAAMYFGIQQMENGFIAPKIMQKSVGLNPIISLFSLLVGFRLGGVFFSDLQIFGNIIGALLAIPVATIVAVVIHDFIDDFDSRKKSKV